MTKAQVNALMSKFQPRKLKTGNLRTPPFRMSYPNLFEKSRSEDGEYAEKYGVTALFPKGCDLSMLEAAAKEAAVAKFGPKVNISSLRWPFRDQGTKDKAGYEPGALFFRANSDVRPGILGPDGKPLTEKNQAPAGFWAVATINFFGYDKKGKGVGVGLQNIAIIAADETFGATLADANEEFDDVLDGSADATALLSGSDHGDDEDEIDLD
jgi:hypothetical protein